MNTRLILCLAISLAQFSVLLTCEALSQETQQSKISKQGRQSLVEKYQDYLIPQNIVFQSSDGSVTHYRVSETVAVATIVATASGRLYRSSTSATPTSSTGYIRVQAGATGCADYGYRGWAVFSLSSLACIQSINDVDQYLYSYLLNEGTFNYLEYDVTRVTIDPQTAASLTLWNAIGSGTLYEDNEFVTTPPSGATCNNPSTEWSDIPAGSHVLNAISSPGWFALGYLVCNNDDPATYFAEFCGVGQLNPPKLIVEYTPKSIPSIPTLSSPTSGICCLAYPVNLAWNTVSGADSYCLQVDNDPGFGSPELDQCNIAASPYTVSSGLSSNTTYYWRVRSSNCAGNSNWPTARSFTTGTITTVEQIVLDAPQTYSLSQNFPNPFNPVTIIEFSLPKQTFVTLTIFNSLGEHIAVLVNKQLSPGTYQAKWTPSNIPSGVYFYQLRSDDFVDTKKFILLR